MAGTKSNDHRQPVSTSARVKPASGRHPVTAAPTRSAPTYIHCCMPRTWVAVSPYLSTPCCFVAPAEARIVPSADNAGAHRSCRSSGFPGAGVGPLQPAGDHINCPATGTAAGKCSRDPAHGRMDLSTLMRECWPQQSIKISCCVLNCDPGLGDITLSRV